MASISFAQAVLQGIVEGLTEFIPVSSTGHLVLLGHLLGMKGEVAETFQIFIQSGAILAVVVLYFDRFRGLFDLSQRTIKEDSFRGINGILKLAICCAPIFILGALVGKAVKHSLFAPLPIALALIAGGILILLFDRQGVASQEPRGIECITYRQCIMIGIFQCLALWPGMSRSASTIIGALLMGVPRRTAAEFSFIAAVPVILAAALFDLLGSFHLLSSADAEAFVIGFVISFFTAATAIKFFLKVLTFSTLRPFAWYRIVLGIVVIALL